MTISKKTFGVLSDGREAELFTLEAGELCFSLSSFGAAWTSLFMPGKTGRGDVLLGFSSLEGYFHNPAFFGSTIGRFANRVGNGTFSLEGKQYQLYQNDGANSLHGGRLGFDKKLWKAFPYSDSGGVFVRFELDSPDGEEGYPGSLRAAVTYGLSFNNEILADYRVWVDAPCPVNLTNHAYFNLAGEGNGDIFCHELLLHASSYVETGSDLIPTGKLIPVKGTPFDFTMAKPIGRDYGAACGGDTEAIGKGYDHCFVVNGESGDSSGVESPENKPVLRPCAEVWYPKSGRNFKLSTSQPGVQFYSGNFLDGKAGKTGSVYRKNTGFCLETQHYPDSPNQNDFPCAIFGPGKFYHEQSIFAFSFK
ncbi:MAG: galactose mutarotase [Treponema sp.]|jgi:aldose 1-epimerase|nr:galactose mutarotase [Treponema sp.]